MNLKQWVQIILVSTSVMALSACHHKNPGQSDVYEANAAYSGEHGAQVSGLGQESGFGDQASGERVAAKRVYYFDFDSNVVHEEDKQAIAANADSLAATARMKVMLEGHTDPRGSREYNIGLGERRAKAIAALLASKGVSSSQLRVVSYGAEKLASSGRDEADYQKDRRVVLVYLR